MRKIVFCLCLIVIFAIGLFFGKFSFHKPVAGSSQQSQKAASTNNTIAEPSGYLNYYQVYQVRTDSAKGKYLTDFQGITLYTYDNDSPGASTCVNLCLETWSIYTFGSTPIPSLPQNISILTRTDGKRQFAWKGKPLYYYSHDMKAGDMLGDITGGQWHIVKP